MAIPRLVRHKSYKHDDTSFTSCPRDSCSGKVEEDGGLSSKLGITGDIFVCRSCGAKWRGARKKEAPKNGRGRKKLHYLSYVEDSCNEQDSVVDEEFHAYE